MFHVIDDEEMLRELLEVIITDAGYDVRCFNSGEAYIEFLKSPEFEEPIAVLSDVSMPGISGYDLVLKIRKTYPLQKIILVTGYADDAHHERASNQLCYTLDKPFKPEKLITLLASLAACEDNNKHITGHEHSQHCKYGIEHDCPFYVSQQTK